MRRNVVLYCVAVFLATTVGCSSAETSGSKHVAQAGCSPIEASGGVADGSAFNDEALATALATSDKAHPDFPCVKFGTGVYRFAKTFSRTIGFRGSMILAGQGSSATKLQWVGGQDAIVLDQTSQDKTTASTFHLRQLTIATEGSDPHHRGLVLNGVGGYGAYPTSDLSDVSFEGANGPAGKFWGVGILVNGWSELNITGGHLLNAPPSRAGTIGILLQGAPSRMPSIVNISSLMIGFFETGIKYANAMQGLTVSQTNILGCSYGVLAPANQAGLSQLTYTDNQSDCSLAHLRLDSEVNPVQISNNLFESAGGAGNAGLLINANHNTIITGNVFLGQQGTGIRIGGAVPGASGIAADNIFSGFSVAFDLTPSAGGWTLHDNRLNGALCKGCASNTVREHDDR